MLSVYLRELGRHAIVQLELERESAVCSVLTYVEVRSTLARAAFKDNPRRLSNAGYERAARVFESDWLNYIRLPLSEDLLRLAGNLARAYLLRAYDSIHLASAIALKERVPDKVLVSTWDKELAAASSEGFDLAYEVTA